MWAIGAFAGAAPVRRVAADPRLHGVPRDDGRARGVSTAGWSGRGAYTLDVFPREERVQSQAFMRAALNIGFTVGAMIGGFALAFNNDDIVAPCRG